MIAMNSAVSAVSTRVTSGGTFFYPEFEHLGPASGFIEEICQIVEQIPPFEDLSLQEVGFLRRYALLRRATQREDPAGRGRGPASAVDD